ncbi:thiamine phosphate synthase [Meiothermus ruber]|uniref:Thiamine-phosphate synthase n=1 Tax=Meiothermus ruber (strain ATCC 35948 / DSM 1279 / VKM B-1258 / 21) TaxID=504728 RepID=D3PTL3_MEIRD|nr:thiamine phosphate synthase [Meiothermus ruber]ADD28796.1 thiamine-phosphate pyrophosphorylase [Meiothermus ruber DSM 1279]AGK05755.1 thiamine-phosphate pyrophosphorylase [Meiothermus ruber DSM 1279]MCL6529451.1 thiamine phosphate synthase [Meiothermus ruber]MCX7801507.1 thiamine phosphate synthase [Meiothermus ruber]GAO75707.1 thiamine-phosphate pyrophosphorylase [Meiothermus ruber H328]
MHGKLYLVATPRPGQAEAELMRRLEAALEGGVDLLQLRAKNLEAQAILALGENLRALCARYRVPLIINDRPDLAALLEAHGVHLGQGDLNVAQARRFFSGWIGRSTHEPEQALREQAALEGGPGYLSVGPVWETPTKPGRPAAGLAYVRWAAQNLRVPWFAIGGIDEHTLPQVLEAGARRVAVVRSILDAPDPEKAARHMRRWLDGLD